jgi:hypothetical protein
VLIWDEFREFRVENGLRKGSLRRKSRKSVISEACHRRVIVPHGSMTCAHDLSS